MNKPHKDARTTQLGRAEMVKRIMDDGQPMALVARGFGISERTARKCVEGFKAKGACGARGVTRSSQKGPQVTVEAAIQAAPDTPPYGCLDAG